MHPHPETFVDLEMSDAQTRAEEAEAPSRNLYVAARGDAGGSDHSALAPIYPDGSVPVRRRAPRFDQAHHSGGQVLDLALVRGHDADLTTTDD